MRRRLANFWLVAVCLAMSSALADEVVLHNGDRITGEVVRIENGKLTVKTPYAGTIKIDRKDIASLTTDKPVYIVIDEINRVQATIIAAEAGTVTLSDGDWMATGPLALDRITGLTREPEPAVKVRGRINIGVSSTSGNTQTEKLHADAEVIARSAKNRFTIGGGTKRTKDREVETESNSRAYLKYDHFITKKWYAYANADTERDKFKDIKLRTTLGVGTGYQFLESKKTNLSVEGGINYVNTDFEFAPDDSYPAGRWAIRFDRFLFESNTQFFHQHEACFGLEDSDNIFVRTQTGLRWPVLEGLDATAQYNVDWDNNPAAGRVKTDRAVLFTLGYRW